MTFSEFEVKRAEKLLTAFVVRRGPPAHAHNQVQLCFRFVDASVEIFEKRAGF
jgi:hypothetical protein